MIHQPMTDNNTYGPPEADATFPIPGPFDPQVPPTWRSVLKDSQERIAAAYDWRRRTFRAAHDAGLSYREISEAAGISPTAVGKIIGRGKATLDSPVKTALDSSAEQE